MRAPLSVAAFSAVALRCRRPIAMLRHAALVMGLIAGGVSGAGAACDDASAKKVVLLKVTKPVDGGGFEDGHLTGIVVSDSGLVLTVYDLIGHIKPNDLIGLTPEELEQKASITLPGRTLEDGITTVRATILGYDWRRDILLLKIPTLDQITPSPEVAELSRKSIRDVIEACFVGYSMTGAGGLAADVWEVSALERVTRGISYHNGNMQSKKEQRGGAVLDATDGTLVGMIQAPDGGGTQFLPIEYADTLLSQLFIARITRELNEVVELTNKMRVRVSWNFQILENRTNMLPIAAEDASDFPSMKIRFFFSQHLRNEEQPISMSKVDLLISMNGVRKNEHGDEVIESVTLRTSESDRSDREAIPISSQDNFFDYDARRQIEEAQKQGFSSLESVRISIMPEFKIGQEDGNAGAKQVFDIKLRPWRESDDDLARTP